MQELATLVQGFDCLETCAVLRVLYSGAKESRTSLIDHLARSCHQSRAIHRRDEPRRPAISIHASMKPPAAEVAGVALTDIGCLRLTMKLDNWHRHPRQC